MPYDADLMTFGKIIGGGLPVAAYGGREDLMRQVAPSGPVYQAGTLSGNPLGMAAGLATLGVLREAGAYARMTAQGEALAAAAAAGVRAESHLEAARPDRKSVV